jgi:hypothetical protein
MASTVKWNFNLSVVQGPSVSLSASNSVDAYDNLSVTIPNDGSSHTVQIAPETSTDVITFIVISSDQYDASSVSSSMTFTYRIGGGTTDITLDGPQFLMSAALVSIYSPPPTNPGVVSMAFTNKTGNPANVTILLGRKAS